MSLTWGGYYDPETGEWISERTTMFVEEEEDWGDPYENMELWPDGVWRNIDYFGHAPIFMTLGYDDPHAILDRAGLLRPEDEVVVDVPVLVPTTEEWFERETGILDPADLGFVVSVPPTVNPNDVNFINAVITNFWKSLEYSGLLPSQVNSSLSSFDADKAQLALAEILALCRFFVSMEGGAMTKEDRLQAQANNLLLRNLSDLMPGIEANLRNRAVVVYPSLSIGSPQRIIGWEHSEENLGAGWMQNKFGSGFVKAVR